jgi:hypothetical protein
LRRYADACVATGATENRRLRSARGVLTAGFSHFGYPSVALKKSAAEPKVYLQSKSGDFELAECIRCYRRKGDVHSIAACWHRRTRHISDSARIFKRLRSAVCASLSQIRHTGAEPAAGAKDFPD